MYKINFDKNFNLISWDVIFWGIKNDILEAGKAIDYANKLIENEMVKDDSLIVKLFILEKIQKNEVLSCLNDIVSHDTLVENNSMKILRYIILDNIRESEQDNKVVLNAIENVYADFNYPEDMNSFISYMPIENDEYNPSEHTLKENEQRLIEKFIMFLNMELQWIEQQNSFA